MNQFCEMKGIKREFSVARTPQQNRVAERKNRTLIEATRTMLADSRLLTTFWAEAVNTACYVQNRVLVIKPHKNTPYELFLGKFDGKADEGFFVGYSTNSKSFRVFNSRTRIVEENLHVQFSENTPNIAGSRPNWLFDVDALTKSMNYKPVVAGNQSNGNAGIKACDDAGKAKMETIHGKDYILLPMWPADPLFSQSSKNSPDDGFKPSGDDEVTEEPGKEGGDPSKKDERNDQEKDDYVNSTNNVNTASDGNSTNNVNAVSSTVNAVGIEVNAVGAKTSIKLPYDPNMPALEDIVYSDDDDVGAEADMNNLDAFMPQRTNHKDFQNCMSACFLSQEEPKKVWTLVNLPNGKRAIGTKWVYRNKKDERGIVIKNKARLVTQGYTQEEGIDYDEIEEEVYVCQPPGFEDPDFPDKVYKVEKALYGLHQAPRAWYETLSTYLLDNGFQRGKIDKTLFIKRDKSDILLVQVYVDDIIFGSTKKSLCTEFEKMMHKKFQMSSMDELTFFLGLQVKQKEDGIFISQDKYVTEILKKFGFSDVKTASTPMETHKPLLKDADGEVVDEHLYRSMIGSLMYLTSSRPDIMFAVCACARFQVNPKISHLHAVKRIFRYLIGQPKLGLWYPKDSPFDLVAYTNSDYAGASLDRKSTTGVKNPVFHSKTKHIEIRHHFIRDSYEKKLIQMIKIHTDHNVADLLTKAFNIEEEVYVCQPPGFEDLDFHDKRGNIDKTLFIRRDKSDILLVQVYVDDIIFGSTKKSLCTEFEKMMHKKFQMSSMGELTFFLGLQVKQKEDGIFISQDKYVTEILKKFGFSDFKTASTPMETHKPLLKDADGEDVDEHLYRSMIESLMYLTSSRPDIIYLKGQPKLGRWYPKDSPFDWEAFTDNDYAEASLDRKCTTGGCQFLGCGLISWQCKKHTVVANSTTEAKYVAVSSCCGQIAQSGMNIDQDRHMLMVDDNVGNQFRQNAMQNVGYLVGQNVDNLQQASTSGTPDLTKLPSMIQMDQLSGGTVEQHPSNVKETRVLYDSLYNNLAIEVEKVNSVNRKLRETNANLTSELARYKNQEKYFEINQEKYDKLERCDQKSVYQEQCLTKKINALHLSSAKQITTLNEEIANLNNQLSKEKSTVSFLQKERKKLKNDFKTQADESLAKHKALEFKIERLLRAVVSQDIMSIVQNPSVVDASNLQTELERLQQKIKRLQAQLGDQKGKSKDTPYVSNTLDPLSQKLENENVELEFQDTTHGTSTNTKFAKQSILGKPPSSFRPKLYAVTPLPKSKAIPKIDESHALFKTSPHQIGPTPTEIKIMKMNNVISLGIFRINPFKSSRSWKVYSVICSTNYSNGENQVVSKSSAVTTADASDKRHQQQDSTSSTSTLATTITADGIFDL
ncbi:putative ribonuclease H-like domain-containing protein [Tanacetum coccineum]